MKELIILRHAKSDWGNEYLKDIDRPLSDRGYNDAYFSSQWYTNNKKKPDLMLSSPATRALSTAFIFMREMNLPLTMLTISDNIYESPAEMLLDVIRNLKRSARRVMMVGHNPGFTDLCNKLSDDMFFENIPTCGIVSYSFDIKRWQDAEPGLAKMNFYQFPKDFKNIK